MDTTIRKPHRLEELDSLRGIAAMIVVAFHISKFWNPPYPAWWKIALMSPLGILFNGPDAVMLFFVLSGFVLYLPYRNPDSRSSYPRFLLKRICRIYLPYLAALAISIGADWSVYRPLPGVSSEAMHWFRPFPVDAILPHILFLGPSPIFDFNPVFWSLVHEMRISIAFPVIAAIAARLPLWAGILSGLTLCCAGLGFLNTSHNEWASIGYAGLFIVGACMARNLSRIRDFAAAAGPYGRGFGFLIAVGLLKSMHWFPERFKSISVQAPIHGAAAALILVLAMTTVHFKKFLHSSVLRWLGRVSYSLYLTHMTVIYCVTCLFWQRTSHHGWLCTAGVAASLLLSNLFYWCVELPSIRLGQRLGGKRRGPETMHAQGGKILQDLS